MPLRSLAITLVACLALVGLAGPFSFHPDTLQDLLAAKDCAELGACAARGSVSRAGGLVNGAVFVHLLALGLPLGVGALWTLGWVLQGLAVGVVAAASRSIWAPVLLLGMLIGLQAEPALWNPTLLPLPTALLTVALLRARGLGGAAVVGLLLWACVEAYTAALVLILAVGLVLAIRSIPRALVALALFVAASLLSSPDAAANASTDLGRLMVVGLGGAVGFAWLFRLRLRRVADQRHLLILLVVLPAGACLALAGIGLVEPRYLLPAAPAAALLIPELCASRARWLPAVLALLLLGVGVGRRAERLDGRAGAWTMPELEQLGADLARRDVRWSSLPGSIQGPRCNQALAGAGLFMPLDEEQAPPRAVQVRRGSEAPGIALAPARVSLLAGCEGARCDGPRRLPLGWFGARDHPAVVPRGLQPDRWTLALRPGPAITLELSSFGRRCPWQVVRGPAELALPARSVALPADAQGELVLAPLDPDCVRGTERMPPCWTEVQP